MPGQFNELPPIKGWYALTQIQRNKKPVSLQPEQIIGLVPCRKLQDECDYRPYAKQCVPVFAELEGNCLRNNDFSTFLFDFPLAAPETDNFALQKWDGSTWNSVATLNNSNYGTFFNFGSFAAYPVRSGYKIEWQKVLQLFGDGYYRFIVNSSDSEDLQYSYPFNLRIFTKNDASKTVRIETNFKGEVGNNLWLGTESNLLERFDLVDMEGGWTDQVRHYGYFGNIKPAKEQTFVKYANDFVSLVHTRQANKYTLQFSKLTEELIWRISLYGFNSVTIKVCNYHVNNSEHLTDFPIKNVSENAPNYYPFGSGGYTWDIEVEKAYENIFQKGGR